MHIDRLAYFVEVAKYGSINLAAESLHLSQQALSLAIKDLEKSLGVAVFVRSNKGVALTSEGEAVLAVVEEIVDAWTKLKMQTRQINLLNEEIRLGITPFLETSYFATMQRYFKTNYPLAKLSIVAANLPELIKMLEANEIHGAMVSLLKIGDDFSWALPEDIVFQQYSSFKPHILLSTKSAYANYKTLSIRQLGDTQIVLEKSIDSDAGLIRQMLTHYNFTNILWVNSVLTARQMVQENLAATFTVDHDPYDALGHEGLITIPVHDAFKFLHGVITTRQREKDPITEILRDCIRDSTRLVAR